MNNKEDSKLKKIIRIVAFIVILVLAVQVAAYVLKDKSSFNKNKDFFAQKEDFDVLFFGSSHTEIFVNPMDLWKEYGIVSYNLGCPEESVPITYWSMRNAITVHTPKVIVYDVSMFNLAALYTDEEHLHYALDSYPLSQLKIDAVNELLNDRDEKLEMFFILGNYHNRWKELKESAFKPKETFVKGNLSYGFWHTMDVKPLVQHELTQNVADIGANHKDLVYLQKIVDMCNENDIELLLVANPFMCQEKRQADIHAVEKFAKDNGVPFINFIDMNSVADLKIDCYDDEHVNQSGLHKVTCYLGSYLKGMYNLDDHRDEEAYANWHDDYDSYKQLKLETLWWMVDDLDITLEMLHDTDYKSYIFVGKNASVNIDEDMFKTLIQNVGRKNITVGDGNNLKSQELFPLELIDDSLHNENYLAICKPDGSHDFDISEVIGDEALTTINETNKIGVFIKEYGGEISSNDIVIVVVENDSNEVKLVRQYDSSGESHEDLYSDVEKVYFN